LKFTPPTERIVVRVSSRIASRVVASIERTSSLDAIRAR
jgi:hypothetical protein|tara:strand:- start:1264 stop:1380 length:117 start_codon:yes stop_codon:yes gene_type:complete